MSIEKESVKEILIYRLIYPAILGSMIYDLIPPKTIIYQIWFVQFLIVTIYIADYCHLYKN